MRSAFPGLDSTGSKAATEKLTRKAVEKFAAFKKRHQELLAGNDDAGCMALLLFLEWWTPDKLSDLPHADEIPGQNIAFRVSGERGFIHDRKAARDLLNAEMFRRKSTKGMCLVTGAEAPIARLHPPIKGIGDKLAPFVSFNEDAFTSYGKLQGANAPVSEAAAFAYATALNGLLAASGTNAKGHPVYRNRVMLGETTVPFWVEHPDDKLLARAEALARVMMDGEEEVVVDDGTLPTDEMTETNKLRVVLHDLQQGKPLRDAAPEMHRDSRVYVLGLSPNAARISVRFWVGQSLGDFARHFQRHWEDLRLDPPPHPWPPPLWRLLLELAPQRKSENVPAHLSGETMRAILTGDRYPDSLLVQALMRVRADRAVTSRRTALIKAVLARRGRKAVEEACRSDPCHQSWKDPLVSLDREETNAGYRLGRLFAVLDAAQYAGIGRVNSGVKDKFFGAASATPGHVFPLLLRSAQDHLASARKKGKEGRAIRLDREISEILGGIHASAAFPTTLSLEDQGRFVIGFYHQDADLRVPRAKGETVENGEDNSEADERD